MRRVVVTGIGSVNPLGADIETSWRNLLAGKSGADSIDKFDTEDLPCRIACPVKRGDGGFSADLFIAPKEQKRVDDFITFAQLSQALNVHPPESPTLQREAY